MAPFADGFKVRTPVQILKDEDRKQIHEAALDVMETVGIRVHSKMARDSLKAAGADVDEASAVVKFDGDLTQSLIAKAPQKIVLAGREKEYDLPCDGTHCYYTTDGCGIAVWN